MTLLNLTVICGHRDSHKVFQTLCRNIDDFPIMVLATSRFNDDGTKPIIKIDKGIIQKEIILNKLEESAANSFIELQLGGTASDTLLHLIKHKTELNPFYIEQFMSYLKENNLLVLVDDHYQIKNVSIDIPKTINAIIIARIDRLENELKNIVQIASVLGREVELRTFLILLELYKKKSDNLSDYFDKIEEQNLWYKFEEIKYIFKHALLHEAVYEMQLKARIRKLHGLAANALIKIYGDSEDRHYEIANHYDKGENFKQALKYYRKAGEYYQENYENLKAIGCFDSFLNISEKIEIDKTDIAKILQKKCLVLQLIGKWDEAEQGYIKCLELIKETDQEILLAECKCDLGELLYKKGQYNNAMEIYKEAKETAEAYNNRKLLAMVLENFGRVNQRQGHYSKAMESHKKQKEIYMELEDKQGYAAAVGSIGNVYKYQGNYTKAIECYKETKQIFWELGNKLNYSSTVSNIGWVYHSQGDYTKAMRCYEESKDICLEIGNKQGYANVLAKIGNVYNRQGDSTKALEYYKETMQIFRELGNKLSYSLTVGNIGVLYMDQGDYAKAMECYNEIRNVFLELEDRLNYSLTISNIGMVYHIQGDYTKAMDYYEEFKEISLKTGNKQGYAKALGSIGNVHNDQGEYTKAIECYDESINIAKELQIKFWLSDFLRRKADVLFSLKEYDKAKTINHEAQSIANETQRKDIGYLCSILDNKLLALDNPDEAAARLTKMLENEKKIEYQAKIHYEIFKINQSAYHHQKVLELYQMLYQKAPKYDYKEKIEEVCQIFNNLIY